MGKPSSDKPAATLAELRESLRRDGLLEKDVARCLAELALHVAVAAGGILIVIWADRLLFDALGVAVCALGSLGVATNGHTSSHYATSTSRRVNEALTYFCYPFFLGVSAWSWHHRHVVVHHPVPNVLGRDEDVDLMPFFAYSERDARSGRGPWRRYYRYQWLVFPLALALNGFNTLRTAWIFLLGRLRDPRERSTRHWVDLGVLGLHWLAWFALPAVYFGLGPVLLFNLFRLVFAGYGMFALFAPAHWPAAALAVERGGGREDYLLIQTADTVNFRTGRLGRLLCSGVDHQIEHHLFPEVSHTRYPAIAARVRAFCERNGYPYRTLGWGEAIAEALKTLRSPKPAEPDPAALRERLRRERMAGSP